MFALGRGREIALIDAPNGFDVVLSGMVANPVMTSEQLVGNIGGRDGVDILGPSR